MSWLFSQALVEVYLQEKCSDGEQYAPSNLNPMPLGYLQQDRMKAFSRLSRYGVTFALLTEDLGAELLTSYLAAFHAKTSAQPVKVQELPEKEADSGKNFQGLLAKFDHASSSWKTAQCSLFEDLELSLETWPRSGSMRNGECYLRPMLEPLTSENESGLWATPTTMDKLPSKSDQALHREATIARKGRSKPSNLRDQVTNMHKWPTPNAQAGSGGGSAISGLKALNREKRPSGNHMTFQLRDAVKIWPTPSATDGKGSGKNGDLRDRLDYAVERGATKTNTYSSENQIGGQLNPTWVEWLMGWPLGWTDLKPLETVKFRFAPPRRGGNSQNDPVFDKDEAA